MKYLLLSDIHNNGKVLEAGLISELKGIDNIVDLLKVKAIVPYTKEEIIKEALRDAEKNDKKIENVIEEIKVSVEAKKQEIEEAEDIGISVEGLTKEPIETKKSGRGRKK